MKNKKIVVFLLIAIMVLGFSLTALVGCKDWKEQEIDSMFETLVQIAENTCESKRLNNMELGASIVVDTTYGESSKKYTVDLAAKLALNADDPNKNSASLTITDNTLNKNVLSLYYDEAVADYVYMSLGEDAHFGLKAVKVKEVLKNKNASVTDDQADGIKDDIVDGLGNAGDIISMIKSFDILDAKISKNKLTYRIETSIGKIFGGEAINQILDMIGENVQTMINNYGIAIDLKTLNTVLPDLAIGINVNTSNKKPEKAVITGLSADLSCPKKDVVIKNTAGGTLLQIDVAKDFKANVKADLFFNPDTSRVKSIPTDKTYVFIGAANFVANGTFELNKDINLELNFGSISMSPKIPGGTYNIELALHADPSVLANIDFESHSVYKTFEILSEVLHKAVRYLKIDIKKDGATTSFLKIELSQVAGKLNITDLNVGALGLPLSITGALKGSIDNVITMIKGFVKDSVDVGYVYGPNTADGKLTFKVDTENGFIDDGTGHLKYQKNGLLEVGKDYTPFIKDGKLIKKGEEGSGYIKNADGTFSVDTANGYVEDKKTKELAFDDKGNLKVQTGFKLYNGRPITEEEYDKLAEEDKLKEEEAAAAATKTISDIIKSLSVIINSNGVSANLNEYAVKVGEEYKLKDDANAVVIKNDGKYYVVTGEGDNYTETEVEADKVTVTEKEIKIGGGLTLNKDGVTVTVSAKQLDMVNSSTISGLPQEEVLITIKLTDIKYGTAPGKIAG